eukprot:10427435-Ditylum_brightwellii.AAC.1
MLLPVYFFVRRSFSQPLVYVSRCGWDGMPGSGTRAQLGCGLCLSFIHISTYGSPATVHSQLGVDCEIYCGSFSAIITVITTADCNNPRGFCHSIKYSSGLEEISISDANITCNDPIALFNQEMSFFSVSSSETILSIIPAIPDTMHPT